MKREKHLWDKITSFENIYIAAKKAMKGKRKKNDVIEFNYELEKYIWEIKKDLEIKNFKLGAYREFKIYDPKERMISTAPFRDRVIHHALCNIIEPIYDKIFVCSYANRIGFGTHRALKEFNIMFNNNKYSLKCDIRKYFPSIDHEILKQLIRKKIGCVHTLSLIDEIIDCSNQQESINEYFYGDTLFTPFERKRGLPIGNLTSQFFANIYLNPLDHFIKEKLNIKNYIRYVDDFVLFNDSKELLIKWKREIEIFLEKFRLKIHVIKSQIIEAWFGVNFLGFRFFPNTIRVRSNSIRRGRKRIRKQLYDYSNRNITKEHISASLQSWFQHISFANTVQLKKYICENEPRILSFI